jgi:hypothetical protein
MVTAGAAMVIACGGNVAPERRIGDPQGNTGAIGIGATGANSGSGNSGYPTGGYGYSSSGYGYGSSGSTYSCVTYSCALNSTICPGGVTNPILPNGCPGPCECAGGVVSPPPLPDAGPDIVDAPVDDVAPACATGSYEFDLEVAPGETFCAVTEAPLYTDTTWLSIERGVDGGAQVFSSVTSVSCDTCTGGSDVVVMQPISSGSPLSYFWDGMDTEPSACGGGGGETGIDTGAIACTRSYCAPPGEYVAHMCAYTDCTRTSGSMPYRCVDVPFVFPPTAPVVGVLQ